MMTYKDILQRVSKAALLEQLAEESAELAKAALKLARIERHENPTPVTYDEAFRAMLEELADVRVCIDTLDDVIGPFDTLMLEREKYQRWVKRLNEFYSPGPEPVRQMQPGEKLHSDAE